MQKLIISIEEQLKAWRKANRDIGLEHKGPRGGIHKTSKKDKQEKAKNTIKDIEDVS